MEYNFVKFQGQNKKSESRITITKSNSIGFPQKFYDDNGIASYKYVVVYWDGENKAIALNFSNNEEEKSKFVISHSKNGYGGSIIARSFFKNNGINPELYSGRYDWEKSTFEGIGEVYIIKLVKKESDNPVSA